MNQKAGRRSGFSMSTSFAGSPLASPMLVSIKGPLYVDASSLTPVDVQSYFTQQEQISLVPQPGRSNSLHQLLSSQQNSHFDWLGADSNQQLYRQQPMSISEQPFRVSRQPASIEQFKQAENKLYYEPPKRIVEESVRLTQNGLSSQQSQQLSGIGASSNQQLAYQPQQQQQQQFGGFGAASNLQFGVSNQRQLNQQAQQSAMLQQFKQAENKLYYEPPKRIVEESVAISQSGLSGHHQSAASNQQLLYQPQQQSAAQNLIQQYKQAENKLYYEPPKQIIEESVQKTVKSIPAQQNSISNQQQLLYQPQQQQQNIFQQSQVNQQQQNLIQSQQSQANQQQQTRQLGNGVELIYENKPNSIQDVLAAASEQNVQYALPGSSASSSQQLYRQAQQQYANSQVAQGANTVQFGVISNQPQTEPLRPHQVTKTEYIVGPGSGSAGSDQILAAAARQLQRQAITTKKMTRSPGVADIPGLFTTKKPQNYQRSLFGNSFEQVLQVANEPVS